MNKDVLACRLCERFKRDVKVGPCDPNLVPTYYLLGVQLPDFPPDKKEFAVCGRFTCDSTGIPAAIEALRSGNFKTYYVGLDRKPVQAVAFGTADKPTQNGNRIVTEEGEIYAYQLGYYLFTGVRVSA